MEVGEDRPEPERLTGAVLDSLASHIAVLDESGTILAVNESWRQFARERCGRSCRLRRGQLPPDL